MTTKATKAKADTETKAPATPPSDEKEAAFAAREAELNRRFDAMKEREATIDKRAEELDQKDDQLVQNANAIEERENAVALQEKALADSAKAKTAEFQEREDVLKAREQAIDEAEKQSAAKKTSDVDDEEISAKGMIDIIVTGPKKGRHRAGRYFGSDPKPVSVTADELELIKADLKLSWQPAD